MNRIHYSAALPVYREVDVVVVGAGPAGIAAAVSAARNGARVFVFDQWGSVGGMATMGLVGPFMTSYDSTGNEQIIKGVFQELVERMCEMGGAIHPGEIGPECSYSGYYKLGHNRVGPFDHEAFKIVATDMIAESGAELLLHTSFVDVLMEDNSISGVIISNKAGLSVVKAKMVIDCTGDGDVAARAGVDFDLGGGEKSNMQPATLFFRVCNVNTAELDAHIAEHAHEIRPFFGPFSWLIREKAEEWEGVQRGEVCLFESPNKGEFRMNVTRILNVDSTRPEDLTRAEIEGTKQAQKAFSFLKKYGAGFKDAIFMGTAAVVGIRESRHIHGIKKIVGDDIIHCRVPADTIAVMATNMDTHNENDVGGSFHVVQNGPYYGVPYGCLVPERVDNLLVAGRCISADAIAASSIRMIPCCIAFGQAAGTAAAMAAESSKKPGDIDTQKLRARLMEQGSYLGACNENNE